MHDTGYELERDLERKVSHKLSDLQEQLAVLQERRPKILARDRSTGHADTSIEIGKFGEEPQLLEAREGALVAGYWRGRLAYTERE